MQLIDQADKFTIWGARFIRQASLAVFTGLIYNKVGVSDKERGEKIFFEARINSDGDLLYKFQDGPEVSFKSCDPAEVVSVLDNVE